MRRRPRDRLPVLTVRAQSSECTLYRTTSLTGRVGLHIGVDAGRLAPEVFTRITSRNRRYYGTIGLGLKFTFDLPRQENRSPY